jgi:hypothetical protein
MTWCGDSKADSWRGNTCVSGSIASQYLGLQQDYGRGLMRGVVVSACCLHVSSLPACNCQDGVTPKRDHSLSHPPHYRVSIGVDWWCVPVVLLRCCWLQVGYFSKEKSCQDNYNLACILTLPAYQRKVGSPAGCAGRCPLFALQPLQPALVLHRYCTSTALALH